MQEFLSLFTRGITQTSSNKAKVGIYIFQGVPQQTSNAIARSVENKRMTVCGKKMCEDLIVLNIKTFHARASFFPLGNL